MKENIIMLLNKKIQFLNNKKHENTPILSWKY